MTKVANNPTRHISSSEMFQVSEASHRCPNEVDCLENRALGPSSGHRCLCFWRWKILNLKFLRLKLGLRRFCSTLKQGPKHSPALSSVLTKIPSSVQQSSQISQLPLQLLPSTLLPHKAIRPRLTLSAIMSCPRPSNRTAFLKLEPHCLSRSKMAAPSNSKDLSLQKADQSTTPTPTPPNRRQGYGPNEIVNEIFSYLDFRERARCASVCKQWHEIADDDLAYRRQYRLDILDRKSMWDARPYIRYPPVCISCHRDLPDQEFSDPMLYQTPMWLYWPSDPDPLVCISCQEILERDLAYLERWRPDLPGRTILWEETPPKEGWREFYILDKILQFDVKHDRMVSSRHKLEAYASRPAIPYHEKNAGIEDYWKRKTNDNGWKVLGILQGAKKYKPIPRLTLWTMAKSDKVCYHVEFELACRGYMRSKNSKLMSAIEL